MSDEPKVGKVFRCSACGREFIDVNPAYKETLYHFKSERDRKAFRRAAATKVRICGRCKMKPKSKPKPRPRWPPRLLPRARA